MKQLIILMSCLLLFVACSEESELVLESKQVEYRNSDQELIGETLGAIFFEYSQIGKDAFKSKLKDLDALNQDAKIVEILSIMVSDLPNSEVLERNLKEIVFRTTLLSEENRSNISEAITIYHNRLDAKTNLKGLFSMWNTGNGSCGQRVFNAFMDTVVAIGATAILAPTGAGAVWAGVGIASEFGNLLVTANECST